MNDDHLRYVTGTRDARLVAHSVPHPFGPAAAAGDLVAVIAAQVAGAEHPWEFIYEGMRWAGADTDPDYEGRSVVVDATPGLSTDLNHPDMPRPWLPGPLVAGYARNHETLIQVPNCIDKHDIRNVVLALVALGVLPDADGMNR